MLRFERLLGRDASSCCCVIASGCWHCFHRRGVPARLSQQSKKHDGFGHGEGKQYTDADTDTDTGYTVHVSGNRVVITDGGQEVTQFVAPRTNILARISSGKWIPK